MDNKKKVTGNKKLYVSVAVFSLVWLFISTVFPVTRPLDYSWDHFVVNLPGWASFFDLRLSAMTNQYAYGRYVNKRADDRITIAAIDDYTIDRYGWPVPRHYYGELVKKLNSFGARSIVFDVILSKSDLTNAAEDAAFVAAVAKSTNVVNLVHVDADNGKVTLPIKGLVKASVLMAHPHVELTLDNDGQVRRYLPFYIKDSDSETPAPLTYRQAGIADSRCGEECVDLPVPSIGIAAYSVYSGEHLSRLLLDYGQERVLNYRDVLWRQAHPGWDTNKTHTISSSYRHISVADIINGRLGADEKAALKGGIVLVGSTAIGAFDHMPSPLSPQFPGVEIHATFVDNLLAGDFRRPLALEIVTALVLLLPWLPILMRRLPLPVLITVCLSALCALAVADVVMMSNNVQMPFATVSLAFFLPFAYIIVGKGLAESREKRWIKNSFGQYLSPKVVDLITKDPSKLSLGGEKREMTAFFMDLEGFTTMSEKLSPEELTSMLNEYLSAFTDIILKHDGTVDKYIGDCIVAFWNAPLDQKDHRKLACLSAVECQAAILRLHDELKRFTIKPRARIGVNSGPMVVGNMGSRSRLSYTVMGDSVNLASRMEGANKFFHSRIMVSDETFADLKGDFDHRFLGSIRVVGKAIPVKVYEPFAEKGKAAPEVAAMLKAYAPGVEKFYAGRYAEAAADFGAALAARPDDGPSKFYLDLAGKYAKEAPKDWDGAFNLTEK